MVLSEGSMKSINKKFSRLLCFCLILILCFTVFIGCESRPLSPNKQALTSVGTVGEYEVSYEELYFLASNYKTEGMSSDELWQTVSENIIANYAILTLCDNYSVAFDEKELDEKVQDYIDTTIEEDFGGSRKKYIEALETSYMTDHYVRFTARTDILYDSLSTYIVAAGDIETDEDKVTEYIKNNFIRTWHFMIANNDGDNAEENYDNAQKALDELKNGKTTMYKLIGGALNEDLLIPSDGYTFTHGSMEKEYEDAAFALKIGEFSDVILAKGELASGEYTDCYYVIQRLSLEDDYIQNNYTEIYKTYEASIVSEKLEEVKSDLKFVPNEYANSLDICNLEPIDAGTDTFAATIISICVAVLILISVIIIIIICHFKKKKSIMLAEAKARKQLRESKK